MKAMMQETGVVRMLVPSAKPKEGEAPDVVTLIGTKDACAKAKAAIAARIKVIDSVVTDTVDLDSAYFKDMRARRGQFLRALQDEHNVHIDLPKADAEGNVSNTVRVRGSPGDVEAAIEKLKAFVHRAANSVTKTHEVAVANLAAIMGSRGVHIQRVEKEHNVSIDIPDRASRTPDQETVELSIHGMPEDVDATIADLKELTPVLEEFELASEFHRFIIGQKGAGIREFQDTYDVRLEIPKSEEGLDLIRIRGTPAKIEAAKDALRARMPEFEDAKAKNFSMTVNVDPRHHSTLIGTRGESVNKLRAEFDVRLDFPRQGAEDQTAIVLTGYQDKCEACAAAIAAKVKELESYVSKTVDIHHTVHGRIIGARGAGVRKLQDEFNVRIVFPKDRKASSLEVVGPEEGVDNCIEQLRLLEEEYEEDILDYEAMQQYVKPERPKQKAPPKPKTFAVRDAPWSSGGDEAAFPTLGGAEGKPASSMGVWGRR
jgi:transcription antitermination factor NusA-like protein